MRIAEFEKRPPEVQTAAKTAFRLLWEAIDHRARHGGKKKKEYEVHHECMTARDALLTAVESGETDQTALYNAGAQAVSLPPRQHG